MPTSSEDILNAFNALRAQIKQILADNAALQAKVEAAASDAVVQATVQAINDAANSLQTRTELPDLPAEITAATVEPAAAAPAGP